MIPAGKVSAANSSVEKGITGKKEGLGNEVKGNRIRRMAGNVGEIEVRVADLERGIPRHDFVDLEGWHLDIDA